MAAPARLPGLDALRGIAAACVLGLHLPAIYPGLPTLFGRAYLAVDFFFMLSGFLMTRTYGTRLAGGFGGWRFLALRYRRLWPVMAVGGLIGAPYLWTSTQEPVLFAALFLANLLLIPVSFQRELFPLNVPAWSVFFELLANLIHGLLLWRLRGRGLVAVVTVSLLATALVARHFGTLDLGARPETLAGGLARALLSYSIGMLLWQRWGDRPPLRVRPLLAALGLPLLIVLPWALGISHWAYDLGFVLLACPLLLAGGLTLERPSPLVVWLGHASFPLYAVHFAVLRQASLIGLGPGAALAAALAVTALVTLWTTRRAPRLTADKTMPLAYGETANGGN